MQWHNWAIVWAVSHREGSRGLGLTHQAHLPSPVLRAPGQAELPVCPGPHSLSTRYLLCLLLAPTAFLLAWVLSTIAKAQHPGPRHHNPKLTPVLKLVMVTAGSSSPPQSLWLEISWLPVGPSPYPMRDELLLAFYDTSRLQHFQSE